MHRERWLIVIVAAVLSLSALAVVMVWDEHALMLRMPTPDSPQEIDAPPRGEAVAEPKHHRVGPQVSPSGETRPGPRIAAVPPRGPEVLAPVGALIDRLAREHVDPSVLEATQRMPPSRRHYTRLRSLLVLESEAVTAQLSAAVGALPRAERAPLLLLLQRLSAASAPQVRPNLSIDPESDIDRLPQTGSGAR